MYNVKDRVLTEEPSKLGANIESTDTTIALSTGDGAKLPSSNCLLKMVQFVDQTGDFEQAKASGVSKEELIEVTTISGDSMSGVTRGIGSTTAQTFAGGSYVLNIISEEIYNKQNEYIRSGMNPFREETLR